MRVAVVGGGAVGTLSALLLAIRGHRVTLFEKSAELWSGASLNNEGKVHLGAVFAAGSARTREIMIRGALAFGPVFEQAVRTTVDWSEVAGDCFDHLVMPDSLLQLEELRAAYADLNERLATVTDFGAVYLGNPLSAVVDESWSSDPETGLPRFRTRERAADPRRLRSIALAAIESDDSIVVRSDYEVSRMTTTDATVTIMGSESSDTFDAAINAAWAWRNRFDRRATPKNFRVKAAVRVPAGAIRRTATLVQGPYGDVVAHRDYGYASWYPTGRIVNEEGTLPSARAEAALAATFTDRDVMRSQLEALTDLGLVPADVDGEPIGGVIVGEGALDINDATSRLHSRDDFGCGVDGRIITPRTFKLTTAPLAARMAVDVVEQWA